MFGWKNFLLKLKVGFYMRSNLEEIRVNNLRALSMDESVSLLPITILIGKNSSGKSTFARSFPLFRQSCEAKKRAPILWFGNYVDYGSFEQAIFNQNHDDKISLEFSLKISRDSESHFPFDFLFHEQGYSKVYLYLEISNSRRGDTIISKIDINVDGFDFSINIDQTNSVKSISCNDVIWNPTLDVYSDAVYESVLPRINFIQEISKKEKRDYVKITPFWKDVEDAIKKSDLFFNKDILINYITNSSFFGYGDLAKNIGRVFEYELSKDSKARLKIDKLAAEIELKLAISKINSLLDKIDGALDAYFKGVKYIEPLRATANRYYRKQELAINEIDSKGENLAMFLDGIPYWTMEEFNKWLLQYFQFEIKIEKDRGHVSILIKEKNGNKYLNLADTGFGFSQMLPVITQIWHSLPREIKPERLDSKTSCIVIEQPELHLHPALQAKLANIFCAAISESSLDNQKICPQIIIETHSNHLINRFGQLINDGKLNSSDIQILIFDKSKDGRSVITKSGFDSQGYLINWPVGFFEPEC